MAERIQNQSQLDLVPKRGLSDGQRRHFRDLLAQARKKGSIAEIERAENQVKQARLAAKYTPKKETKITDQKSEEEKDSVRMKEIKELLSQDSVTPSQRAELVIERYFFKIKYASPEERSGYREMLSDYRENLQVNDPSTYQILEEVVSVRSKGAKVTRFGQIRERVIPGSELSKYR